MARPKLEVKRPEWFKLEKYAGMEKLSLEGWFVQINRRIRPFPEGLDDPVAEKEAEAYYRLRLKEVRENPLGNDPRFKPTPPKELWNKGPVSLATPHELGHLLAHDDHDPELDDPEDPRLLKRSRIFEAYFLNKEKWASEPIEDPCQESLFTPLLSINLRVSDDILKRSFASLLVQLRNRKPWKDIKEYDIKADIKSWVDFAILPYWDLRTWSEETRNKISQNKMADMIFPPGEKDLNAIRNTTKPKAEKIFSESFLDVIGSLCVEELS